MPATRTSHDGAAANLTARALASRAACIRPVCPFCLLRGDGGVVCWRGQRQTVEENASGKLMACKASAALSNTPDETF
eukprot:365288-Chlamydomonas_euryale.AAC.8